MRKVRKRRAPVPPPTKVFKDRRRDFERGLAEAEIRIEFERRRAKN